MPKLKKTAATHTDIAINVGSDNIFRDLGFPEPEAVNLHARGELAIAIRGIIQNNRWSQRRAAKEMGIPQPRIAEIMKMKIEHYSVDILLKYLDKLDRRVHFVIKRKSPPLHDKPTHREIVEGMRTLRTHIRPDKMTVREMIEEGRRL